MGHTVIRQRKDGSGFKLLVIALAMGTLLVGCSSTGSNSARVVDRNSSAPKRPTVTSGQYVVKPGDTLFSIAFRYGWDYKELAARNGIAPPYTIRPGQAIRFSSGSGSSTTVVSGPSSSPHHGHAAACHSARQFQQTRYPGWHHQRAGGRHCACRRARGGGGPGPPMGC